MVQYSPSLRKIPFSADPIVGPAPPGPGAPYRALGVLRAICVSLSCSSSRFSRISSEPRLLQSYQQAPPKHTLAVQSFITFKLLTRKICAASRHALSIVALDKQLDVVVAQQQRRRAGLFAMLSTTRTRCRSSSGMQIRQPCTQIRRPCTNDRLSNAPNLGAQARKASTLRLFSGNRREMHFHPLSESQQASLRMYYVRGYPASLVL